MHETVDLPSQPTATNPPRLTAGTVLDPDTTKLESLLLRGADANALEGGGSPLHLAVASRRHAAVEILLDRGCELPPTGGSDAYGDHPLMAIPPPTAEIVGAFLGRGLVPADSPLAAELLCRAAAAHDPTVTELLLRHGVDANARVGGATPLMHALAWADGHGEEPRHAATPAVVAALLEHGADPRRRDAGGRCVLDYRPCARHEQAWGEVCAGMPEARPRGWWRGVLHALNLYD